MKYKFLLLLIMSLILKSETKINPPKTPLKAETYKINDFEITDYYKWLENKDNADVKKWSKSQHKFTLDFVEKNYLHIHGLREEISSYLDRDYIGSPFFIKKREFHYEKRKGSQQNKLFTKLNNIDVLIFDPEKFDPTGKSSINIAAFNDDGSQLAIGIQKKGNEINEVRIIDTKTADIIAGPFQNIYSWSWTRDSKAAYISFRDDESISKQLPIPTYFYKMGDDINNKKILVSPTDAKDHASIWDSEFGDMTFLSQGDFYSNTLSIRKQYSEEKFKVIYSSKDFKVEPYIKNNKIYLFTNYNAPNFKIMVTELDKPEFLNWSDFISESKKVMQNFVITNSFIIVQYKENVISHLEVFDLNGKYLKTIENPELSNIGGINYNEDIDEIFVSFNTFTSTSKIYTLNGTTLNWKFYYQDQTNINTDNIDSKLEFYQSKDGTKIPLFIIFKKGIKLDGNNPTLLYGYGGFNISMSPSYIGTTSSFVNRGGVYAIACLRGGNEYGENWHKAGMLFKKQNTFDDFISAAEYLIEEKYTNKSKLVIKGGSNGGLLVGATITQRPDLFKAAVCSVPLLDMLNYHKFLIARFWIPEYGDPDKKEDFLNILKYSPYHNIKPGFNYPTMLIKAGENDSRVDPLHAKKFAAALQNNPGQKNPILLFVDFESGHGSGQSIDQQVNNIELEWKFIMNNLGIK